MAYYNTYEELEKAIQGAGQVWSDADRANAQKDLDYGNSIYTLKSSWQDAWNRGDKKTAASIHDQTETFRKQYGGYSGGEDGSGYIKDSTYFNYTDPYQGTLDQLADQLLGYGKFENPYQEQTDAVLQDYLDRGEFSYDLDSDPIWQQYQKTYLREGQRAREDTLGNMAAAMGGQTSTAAINAASQAQDYYNAQMADQIPALYQQAWNQYLEQGNEYLNQINTLRGLGSDARSDWSANLDLLNNQLSGIQSLSDTAYGRAYDDWAADYQASRDALSDSRYDEELAYDREYTQAMDEYEKSLDQYAMDQDARAEAREQAYAWLQMGVMPSDAVLAAAGLDSADAASYLKAVQAQMYGTYSGGGSGGSSSSGSKSSGSGSESGGSTPSETEWERLESLYRDAMQSANPSNFIASNYKNYGFTHSTGLSSGYADWAKKQTNGDGSYITPQSAKYSTYWGNVRRMYDNGATEAQIAATLQKGYQSGDITASEVEKMLHSLGID